MSISAATAITHIGPECPSCKKTNHPGTLQCVFCGTTLATAVVHRSTPPPPATKVVVEARGAASQTMNENATTMASATIAGTSDPQRGAQAADKSGAKAPGHGAEGRGAVPEPHREPSPADGPPPPTESSASRSGFASAANLVAAMSHGSASLKRSGWSVPFDDLPQPVADPLIGVVVADRYRILEGLGRGGMGIVYKVEHKQIGKLLAMKVLTGELSHNPEVVRRFKHEALTASRLSSPNTVQVFDYGISDKLTYLVMELVTGEDLGRILRSEGPMLWSRLCKLMVQVCSSLSEAHQKGIVHRDIKPENIMLVRAKDGTDIAKVLDFGLAKLREGEGLSELTSQGAIVGTPYFMSPEQVRGDPVDARSDIYSLGALMYRALTGFYPFNGPTPMSVFTKHLTEVPVAPVDRAPDRNIPLGLSRIVMRSLHKNPAERFSRVEELQAAIVDQLRSLGTSSVDALLDSGAVRKLEKAQEAAAPRPEIATRDEVEAYERKLRRQRAGAYVFLLILFAGGVAAGVHVYTRPPLFSGSETEPNNVAGDANAMPFGRTVSAYLGRRVDPSHGDRDFYSVEVPPSAEGLGAKEAEGDLKPQVFNQSAQIVQLRVSPLPNIAMCTMLYKPGLTTALAQFCVGRPGRELSVPSLRLDPGRYLIAVLQDVDPYGAPNVPYVYENISDAYTLTIEAGERTPGEELEPNDQIASCNPLGVGEEVSGVLGWAQDRDVFCVPPDAAEKVRFRISDSLRDPGVVLEVTPLRGGGSGVPVRVHAGSGGTLSASDMVSPWVSDTMAPDGDSPRCVSLRLTLDPWSASRGASTPHGGTERYEVEVERAP